MLPEGVTREDAYGCMAVNFLRGVSSVKGIETIDAILARDQYRNIRSERLMAIMRGEADNDNSEDN